MTIRPITQLHALTAAATVTSQHIAYTNPDSLPPLPTSTTTTVTDYPDPLTSHNTARTLAMHCLRKTSSPNLNPDVLPEMDQALTTVIDQLHKETTKIETLLPRLHYY